jgi:hypothetical protein
VSNWVTRVWNNVGTCTMQSVRTWLVLTPQHMHSACKLLVMCAMCGSRGNGAVQLVSRATDKRQLAEQRCIVCASPACRKSFDLGQFERFRRIMHIPAYRPLLNHEEVMTLSTLKV